MGEELTRLQREGDYAKQMREDHSEESKEEEVEDEEARKPKSHFSRSFC